MVIQNNWVVGTDKKMERAHLQKQWFLEESGEKCLPSQSYLKEPILFLNGERVVHKDYLAREKARKRAMQGGGS